MSDGDDTSVDACLAIIDVPADKLQSCTSLTEEFSVIKKAYFKKVLVVHPDKGGDAAEFRLVNESFELLRSLFEDRSVASFVATAETAAPRQRHRESKAAAAAAPKSWQFYYDAAAELVPPYRVELAKSDRSKCNASRRTKEMYHCPKNDPLIAKGDIRVGSVDMEAGSYGRWSHLCCWRVPSSIWLGLPTIPDTDAGKNKKISIKREERAVLEAEVEAALAAMNEVLLCGFNELSSEEKYFVVQHVMNKTNWAKFTKKKGREVATADNSRSSSNDGTSSKNTTTSSSTDIVPVNIKKPAESTSLAVSIRGGGAGYFVVPSPGVNGAQAGFLKGKTVVMTGVFPEIGGGAGLNLGKDRLKSMCESFGARVTSSVSGRTDLLIVGQEPGMSKVMKARSAERCRLVNLSDLTSSIYGNLLLEQAPAPDVQSFSSGYRGNGLALRLTGPAARKTVRAKAPKAKKMSAKTTVAKGSSSSGRGMGGKW